MLFSRVCDRANVADCPTMEIMSEATITCPILIGRDRYLTDFAAAFAEVIEGRGRTITVAGEAGVGKSRLVRELVARAREIHAGVKILTAGCFEGDAAVPFAPVADLWRTFALSLPDDELKIVIGRESSDIVKLVPELGAPLGTIDDVTTNEPEQEKRRLLQALLQPIVRLCSDGPLLVVFEDLHWSDDASIEFLLQLARRAEELPLALLLTYRVDEASGQLASFLAELERRRLARDFTLRPLSRSDVRLMVRAMLDGEQLLRDDFVQVLYELTDGNPFFIEEVLKSLATSNDLPQHNGAALPGTLAEHQIPRSVQEAVRRRTAQLSPGAQRVLIRASVAGRRFDLPLLARLSDEDEHDLLHLVKELVDAQLVVEEAVDRFAFRHALTQQAVYSSLLRSQRRAVHAEIAAALESVGHASGESRLGELAMHTYEANTWDRAFEYACRAGEQAQELFSPAAAMAHFTRALEAASHTGVGTSAWIYSARGRAHDALGNFDGARDDHEAALRLSRGSGDQAGEWQALIDLGALWSVRDYDRAGEFYQGALDLARAGQETAVLGRSQNRLGNWLINVGRTSEGIEQHRAALDMFSSADDRHGIAETLDLLAMAYGMHGDLPRCVDHYGEAIELLLELGDEQRLMSALSGRTTYGSPSMAETVCASTRTLDGVRSDGEAALRLAERSGSSVGSAFAYWTLGGAVGSFGAVAEGMALIEKGLRIATEIQHEQWITGGHFSLGQLHWLMLQTDDAIRHLEAALPLVRSLKSAWWIGNVSAYLALAYLQRGDTVAAREILGDCSLESCSRQTLPERRVAWAMAELLVAEKRADDALALTARLLSTIIDPLPSRLPSALLVTRAHAFSAIGDHASACDLLKQAEASAAVHGTSPWLWRTQCALSRAYAAADRRAESEAKSDEARAAALELAEGLDAEARQRFLDAGDALLQVRAPTARRAAKREWEGLTEREREVAALVTRGHGNRQIAEELVLSERTVETHVGNILTKLGFTSRAQIAAWGAKRGLLGD